MQGVKTTLVSVASAIVYLRVPFDCTLQHLVIYAASPLSGAATFDVNYGDTPAALASIYGSPSGRPVIATGQSKVSQSGLSVALHADGLITLDLDAPPLGGVPGPVFVLFEVDDGLPSGVTVAEADGSPSILATVLRVGNGDLTDAGGGVARLRTVSDVLGQANGAAQLDGAGKLVITQLPALAINERFSVGSQSAMLALTAERGDVAFRTDSSEVYFLVADDPTQLSNWALWLHPAIPTTLPPSGAAGGDVGGSFPSALEVVAIRSVTVEELVSVTTNFGDDFNDNSFDATKWVRDDPTLVLEQSARLEMSSGSMLTSAGVLDVTNRHVQLKVTPQPGAIVYVELTLDGVDHYSSAYLMAFRLRRDTGQLYAGRHGPGGDEWTSLTPTTYGGEARVVKFEHNSGDGLWHFSSSADDGASWDSHGAIAATGGSPANCRLCVLAVSGASYVDDVATNVPVGSPGIQDGDVLRYVSADDRFEHANITGMINVLGSAPSSPPAGWPAGKGWLGCVGNTLYMWDGTTMHSQVF